ncbi:MAG: T9SS type A sorting domain-containing protein [Bacteroidia bacterium]|nr:T9SS type A sorting domain-containing protein [Bacteroidia bacterium]
MKKLLVLAALFGFNSLFSQTEERTHACAVGKIAAYKNMLALNQRVSAPSAWISHEKAYDVKFVHLMLNSERNTKYISGGVRTVATVTYATLDTFACVLAQAHTIDSARVNGVLSSVIRKDSIVKIKTPSTLLNGQTIDVTIWYRGTPPVGGSAIGSGYSNGTSTSWGNQATWSLSESLAGYHWWPCKQILTDKIDSSWVFVTTDSANKVGSNGILKNVVTIGNKKRYEWKSKTPIAYYLISVAIAKYKEYNLWAKPTYLAGDSIWIQNYIYDNAINNTLFATQKNTLNQIKPQMVLMCDLFGMYPFYKEKYGHCMAPFGGGMEHQTMTSLGFFDYYIDAHELGHQWWGDNVTCKSWGDIWINEGFASYSEHLTAQYLDPTNLIPNLNSAHNNVKSQLGGSVHFTGADTMNATRIFSGRLTYDKGGAILRTLQFVVNNDSLWFPMLRGFQNTYKNSTASTVDFINYAQTFTSMNFSQFFNQWYYGHGFPTFNVTWNSSPGKFYLNSAQTTSSATSVPLFITPMEYKVSRTSLPDTTIRVMHNVNNESYIINLLGTVTSVTVDPNQWVINNTTGPTKDVTIGLPEGYVINPEITITPNPNNGVFEMNSSVDINGVIEIYDVTGKLIHKEIAKQKNKIDISSQAAGIYTVVIKDDKGVQLKATKVVKE